MYKPKLRKLTLKKFHGERTQWLTWWESFSSAVSSNKALSDVDKFTYLRTLSDGPVGSAIAALPLTSENYANAIDILRTRYGNKQITISHHMDILLKLPVAPSLNDLRKLRQIYDTTESNVRGLQSLGIHADSYGNLLLPVMFSKLPEELRLIISRKFDNDTWEIDLLQAFKAELEARGRVGFLNPTVQQDKNQQGGARSRPPTAAALVTPWQQRRANSNNGPTCSFCRKNHQTAKCNNVTDIDKRKEILRKQGRCYCCLKGSHIAKECQSQIRSFLSCGRRHHVAVCDNLDSRAFKSSPQNIRPENVIETRDESTAQRDIRPIHTDIQTKQLVTGLYINTNTKFFFKPHERQLHELILTKAKMFEFRSQRTFISTELKEKLNLPTLRTEKLLIKTFGSEESELKSCDIF